MRKKRNKITRKRLQNTCCRLVLQVTTEKVFSIQSTKLRYKKKQFEKSTKSCQNYALLQADFYSLKHKSFVEISYFKIFKNVDFHLHL